MNIMSIHNTLFFMDPRNYAAGRTQRYGTSVIVPETTDDDFQTYSTETDLSLNIADGSSPTAVDYIFIKYRGDLGNYRMTPSGGTGSPFTRTVPTTVQNYEGDTVSLEVAGFKHDLFEVPSPVTATSLRLQLTGAGVQVYDLMILELGLEIHANRDWGRILPIRVDRTGFVRQNRRGNVRYAQRLGATRNKWEYDLEFLSRAWRSDVLYREVLSFKEAYPNCAFSREFTRYPEEVLRVTFSDTEIPIALRNPQWKGGGDRMPVRLQER